MAEEESARMIQHFGEAAACLAEEASLIALTLRGPSRETEVAERAAHQAQEAADLLARLAREGGTLETAFTTAAWALSAAAVAISQARASLPLPARAAVPP